MIEAEHLVLSMLEDFEWEWETGDMVCMLDENGIVQYSNKNLPLTLGYETIVGKSLLSFVHPKDRDYVREAAIKAAGENHPVINKKEMLCKDGNYVVFRSLIVPIIEDGEVFGRMIISRKRNVDILPFRQNRNLIERIYFKKVI